MNEITLALDTATTLFGVVVTLAVFVTGFYIGRRWLRLMGDDMKDDDEAWEDYTARRSRQDNY